MTVRAHFSLGEMGNRAYEVGDFFQKTNCLCQLLEWVQEENLKPAEVSSVLSGS